MSDDIPTSDPVESCIHEPRVLVSVPLINPLGRDMLRGINRYMHAHGPWRILLFQMSDPIDEVLTSYPDMDGMIGIAWGKGLYEKVSRWDKPVILLTGRDDPPGLPRILDDDEGICKAAFEHLRQTAHSEVAFFGARGVGVFERRGEIFEQLARQAGLTCHVYQAEIGSRWSILGDRLKQEQRTMRWLLDLPKPIGVFCATGTLGRDLLDAAISAGIYVPEELAVVAVGYGELLAESCSPPLSTVEENLDRAGYRAAELLTQAMSGEDLTGLVETIPAGPVTPRASSEALHIDDPAIAQAVRRVRRLACEPLGIDEILEDVPVSRRTVELGFSRYLGRTIHGEILRVRIQRARRMLRLTDLPIVDIGVRCGFNSRSRFYECFTEAMGVSPGEYRKRRSELT